MKPTYLLLVLAVLAIVSYLIGRARGHAMGDARNAQVHSRPGYYGGYLAIWTALVPTMKAAVVQATAIVFICSKIIL